MNMITDWKYNFEQTAVPWEMDFKPGMPTTMLWDANDTEERFKKHHAEIGDGWHYANTPVSYERNKFGHRSKLLSEVDDNFMIAYGCSFTEGIGLAVDEGWASQCAKILGMDLLNFGKGGGNAELVFFNTMLFLQNSKKLPKCVIIQWPEISRQFYKNLDGNCHPLLLVNHNPSKQGTDFFESQVRHGADKFNASIAFRATQLLWKQSGVPVYNWTFGTDYADELGIPGVDRYIFAEVRDEPRHLYYARDLQHYGHAFNTQVAIGVSTYMKINYPHLF